MTFIEIIKDVKFLIVTIFTATSIIVGAYINYTNNIKQLEYTQISILKSLTHVLENNPCKVTRDEWADYEMLYSQYQTLLKKQNPLLKEASIRPVERLLKDSDMCYRGICKECNKK